MGSIDAPLPSLTDNVEVILLGTGTSLTVPHVDCLAAPPGVKKCQIFRGSMLYVETQKNIPVRTLFCAGPLRPPGSTLNPGLPDLIMTGRYLRHCQSPCAGWQARVSYSTLVTLLRAPDDPIWQCSAGASLLLPSAFPGPSARRGCFALRITAGLGGLSYTALLAFLHTISSAACKLLISPTHIQDHCH